MEKELKRLQILNRQLTDQIETHKSTIRRLRRDSHLLQPRRLRHTEVNVLMTSQSWFLDCKTHSQLIVFQ